MRLIKKIIALSLSSLGLLSPVNLAFAGKYRIKRLGKHSYSPKLERYNVGMMFVARRKLREIQNPDKEALDRIDALNKKISRYYEKQYAKQNDEMLSVIPQKSPSDIFRSKYGELLTSDDTTTTDYNMLNSIKADVSYALDNDEARENEKKLSFSTKGCNITFVGDTHGDVVVTRKIIESFLEKLDNDPGEKILFLGDYVDKWPASVMNFMLICALKATFPNNVYMLRGNHEYVNQNAFSVPPNLYQELGLCYSKWIDSLGLECTSENVGSLLTSFFGTIYEKLPFIANVDLGNGQNIICLHGGVPRPEQVDTVYGDDPIDERSDIIWNDATPCDPLGNQEFIDVPDSGRNLFFPSALSSFLQKGGYDYMVRGHQALTRDESSRLLLNYGHQLFTVYSSRVPGYDYFKPYVVRLNKELKFEYEDVKLNEEQ